ncbi:MAG TPA: ABC-2 family transporter protein [Ktedonobacteraceae bacterium]|jgi:ABC-2 type transport system permease protein|nr:ABC-2 family transporter protein [Ktedonobacteraceae bacterium]
MGALIRVQKRTPGQRLVLVLRKYLAVMRVSIASNLAYMMEVFFRGLFLVVLIFVLGQLWKTTYSARGATLLSGFSISDMIWYLAAAEMIATSMPALTRRIDQEVRSGQLAYLLVRPCSYVFYNFAQYLGERVVRFIINGIVAASVALIFVGPPHLTWMGVVVWPFVTLLAMCIDFVAYFSIGLLAFWTEDTNSFSFVFSRLTLVLGGVLAPLEIFPQPLRSIAQALPFSAILYGPARTLVHFEFYPFLGLLEQQLITLAVGGAILFAIYSVAIRRVSINGG